MHAWAYTCGTDTAIYNNQAIAVAVVAVSKKYNPYLLTVMPRPAFDNPVTFTAGRLDIDGHVHHLHKLARTYDFNTVTYTAGRQPSKF